MHSTREQLGSERPFKTKANFDVLVMPTLSLFAMRWEKRLVGNIIAQTMPQGAMKRSQMNSGVWRERRSSHCFMTLALEETMGAESGSSSFIRSARFHSGLDNLGSHLLSPISSKCLQRIYAREIE